MKRTDWLSRQRSMSREKLDKEALYQRFLYLFIAEILDKKIENNPEIEGISAESDDKYSTRR